MVTIITAHGGKLKLYCPGSITQYPTPRPPLPMQGMADMTEGAALQWSRCIQSSGSQKLSSVTMHKDAGDHLLIMSSPSWEEQEPMQNSAWSHFKRITVLSKALSTSSTNTSQHLHPGESCNRGVLRYTAVRGKARHGVKNSYYP